MAIASPERRALQVNGATIGGRIAAERSPKPAGGSRRLARRRLEGVRARRGALDRQRPVRDRDGSGVEAAKEPQARRPPPPRSAPARRGRRSCDPRPGGRGRGPAPRAQGLARTEPRGTAPDRTTRSPLPARAPGERRRDGGGPGAVDHLADAGRRLQRGKDGAVGLGGRRLAGEDDVAAGHGRPSPRTPVRAGRPGRAGQALERGLHPWRERRPRSARRDGSRRRSRAPPRERRPRASDRDELAR